MKRIHLVEWGIITIALIFGYKFFESMFSLVIQLFYSFGMEDIASDLLKTLLILALYAAVFILLIRNSFSIAKSVTGAAQGESLPLTIGKRALTHIIILTLCFYAILSNATRVIFYIFETFKREVGGSIRFGEDGGAVSRYQFQLAAGEIILALIVLFFSKDIVHWFIRKNEADELVFDAKPENGTDVQQ